MIINGGSRSNGSFFAQHLMRADHNERVAVVEIRGLAAETIRDAFREMRAIASGTQCRNYFYHANLNTREDEQLTAEQWQLAADTLERELGLTDQPRFVVEHDKAGRTHRHVVWSRIDADSMTAISDSLTYPKHERAAREIEQLFGHEPVDSVLVKGRETPRPERNPADWEGMRAQESRINPKAMTAEVTALWQQADSGSAFAAALEERGFILVRGDRRDFCIVDAAGDEHALARRISGVKAAEIRERLAEIDREALLSVAEGRALARERLDSSSDAFAPTEVLQADPDAAPAEASPAPSLFDQVHAETTAQVPTSGDPGLAMFLPERAPASADQAADPFAAAHQATIAQARSDAATVEAEEAAAPGSRFERIRAWWGNMREHFSDWRDQLQERYEGYRSQWSHAPEPEPEPSQGGSEPQL